MDIGAMRTEIDGVLVTCSVIPPSKAHPFVLKASKFLAHLVDSTKDYPEIKLLIDKLMAGDDVDIDSIDILHPMVNVALSVDEDALFSFVEFLTGYAHVGGTNGTFDEMFYNKPLDMPYKVAWFVAMANFRKLFTDAAQKYLSPKGGAAEAKNTHQTPI